MCVYTTMCTKERQEWEECKHRCTRKYDSWPTVDVEVYSLADIPEVCMMVTSIWVENVLNLMYIFAQFMYERIRFSVRPESDDVLRTLEIHTMTGGIVQMSSNFQPDMHVEHMKQQL